MPESTKSQPESGPEQAKWTTMTNDGKNALKTPRGQRTSRRRRDLHGLDGRPNLPNRRTERLQRYEIVLLRHRRVDLCQE